MGMSETMLERVRCSTMKMSLLLRRSAIQFGLLPACALCLFAVAACSAGPNHVYKLYPGPQRAPGEMSIVRIGEIPAARIDHLTVAHSSDWNEVHLLPGEHTIEWGREFHVSVMVEPTGFARGEGRETLVLEPGHIYILKAARTTGPGYRMYFWIKNETTGQIVAGTPKP
jgi:hypothetical protein